MGSVIYPKNNAFVGASLKWNLQDALSEQDGSASADLGKEAG